MSDFGPMDVSRPNSAIQQDAQGRSFILMGDGQKKYISPAAMGQPAPSGGGIFHTRPTFNQNSGNYESGLDWGNILSMVVAGIMTAGVADALMSAPAGTTQAMISSGAATNTGGAATATVGTGAGGGTAGGVAAVAGEGVREGLLGPSMESQYDANTANGSGFHLPTGAGGKVIQALTALGGAGLGRALSNQAGSNNVPPELQQMLQMAMQRGKYQQPLFESANRGMYQMLPNFARTPTTQFPEGG